MFDSAEAELTRIQCVTAIPPSPEVIEQESKVLRDLYRRANAEQQDADYESLSTALSNLGEDPERALRVAMVWAHKLVVPLRDQFNLADPRAGIYLNSNQDPEEGEVACGAFVNYVLREDYPNAHQTFAELVNHDTRDTKIFLSLLLALAS